MGTPLRRNGTQSDPWFRPELKANAEGIGEAHDDEKTYLELAKKWAVDQYVGQNTIIPDLTLTNTI